MREIQLPSGEWVTTPFSVGSQLLPQCPENEPCVWQDFGPPAPPGLIAYVSVQLQRCVRCRWVRGRYLDNPDSMTPLSGGSLENR